MNEQEKYFDRKIAGRLENAEAEAPFSWEEMDQLIHRKNRRGLGWLRGFFFADVLWIGLMIMGSIQFHEPVKIVAEAGTIAGSATGSPEKIYSATSDEVQFSQEEQVDSASIFSGSTIAIAGQDKSTITKQAETNQASANVHGYEKSVGAKGKASLRKAHGDAAASSGETIAYRLEENKSRSSAGDEPSKRNTFTGKTAVVKSGNSIGQPDGKFVDDAEITDVTDHHSIAQTSESKQEALLSMRGRTFQPEPRVTFVDSVIPSGKQGAKLQEDELSPTLISVYGSGFLEKVNYTSLLTTNEQLDFQRKVHSGMGFGMMLGYQMSPRYSVHLGLEFTRREIAFDWTTTGVQTDVAVDSQWVQIVTPDTSYFTWDYDSTFSIKAVREKLGYSASVSVLTIPVVVQYAIVNGAWVWSPYAGLEYNSRTATRLIRKYNPDDQVTVNESNLKETWNYFSLRAGIKLIRRLNANVDVFSGLDFRYHIPLNRQNLKGGATYLQLGVILHR